MLYPFTFRPLFKERLWGGRKLERLFHKQLPANLPIGESWEISDRPEDVTIVDAGPLAGVSLHDLTVRNPTDLLGRAAPVSGRFPLLIKILDAEETLSLQVHPADKVAAQLGGEPKTEAWYVVHADPGAELFAGLRRGVTAAEFRERLETGTVAECFHRIPVRAGDAMLVPSGRVHGIGKGCVIFEIQQNSDTTYRVFDWNRPGRDGKPRELHIAQSLRAIDFDDFEPGLIATTFSGDSNGQVRSLVSCPYFNLAVHRLSAGNQLSFDRKASIVGVVRGHIQVKAATVEHHLGPGRFCLLPACVSDAIVQTEVQSEVLVATVE